MKGNRMARKTGYRHDMSELTAALVRITSGDMYSAKYVTELCNVQDEVWVKRYTHTENHDTASDIVMVDKSWLRLDDKLRRIDYQKSSYRDTRTVEKNLDEGLRTWSIRVYRFNQDGARFATAVSAPLLRDLANEVFECEYKTLRENAYQVPKDLCKKLTTDVETLVLFSPPGESVDVLVEPITYSTFELVTD